MKNFKSWLKEDSISFPIEDSDNFWEKMQEYLAAPTTDDSAGAGYDYVRCKLTKMRHAGSKRMYFLISSVETFNPTLFYAVPTVRSSHAAANAFETERNADKPDEATNFFVTTSSGLFTSMRMQQAYISSTFSGVLMALGLALGSLVLFIGNLVTAFLAFLSICSVVCCTLGLMVMLDWQIGPIEAICATIVVGFSVDYIVHYALSYTEAPECTRVGRLTRALVDVGISVLSGAITTMGASAFLLATRVQFLFKFGVFMLGTVAFFILAANFLFASLMAILGPERDFGSLSASLRRARNCRKSVEEGASAGARGSGQSGHYATS
ncbi:hypothetical protein T492DRAFT_1019922 [Pavlovales sp. CCMP2436]|nr:hypothetical protein T492DRAFT_1019922 [Pavlovales sp. CCMP2436]